MTEKLIAIYIKKPVKKNIIYNLDFLSVFLCFFCIKKLKMNAKKDIKATIKQYGKTYINIIKTITSPPPAPLI